MWRLLQQAWPSCSTSPWGYVSSYCTELHHGLMQQSSRLHAGRVTPSGACSFTGVERIHALLGSCSVGCTAYGVGSIVIFHQPSITCLLDQFLVLGGKRSGAAGDQNLGWGQHAHSCLMAIHIATSLSIYISAIYMPSYQTATELKCFAFSIRYIACK